jgi:hypothetical protein
MNHQSMVSFQDILWIYSVVDGTANESGDVDGVTRLEKMIFFCSRRLKGKHAVLQSMDFERGYFGPRDPGASYDLETNFMLGIYRDTGDETNRSFGITTFGRRFIQGVRARLSLEPSYEEVNAEIEDELASHKGSSLSQILKDERVVDVKKKLLREKVR